MKPDPINTIIKRLVWIAAGFAVIAAISLATAIFPALLFIACLAAGVYLTYRMLR